MTFAKFVMPVWSSLDFVFQLLDTRASQNDVQVDPSFEKAGANGLPEKHTHKYEELVSVGTFPKGLMFKGHCKTHYNTMLVLEPSPAIAPPHPSSSKKHNTQLANHQQILKKPARRPPETACEKRAPPKNKTKKTHPTCVIWGGHEQGTRASLGHPGSP